MKEQSLSMLVQLMNRCKSKRTSPILNFSSLQLPENSNTYDFRATLASSFKFIRSMNAVRLFNHSSQFTKQLECGFASFQLRLHVDDCVAGPGHD